MLLVNHFLLVFCALLFGRMLHSVLMFNVLDKGIKSKLYMLKKNTLSLMSSVFKLKAGNLRGPY